MAVTRIRQRLTAFGDQFGRDPATLPLTSVNYLVPPGLRQVGQAPGALLGGSSPSAESVLDDLNRLREVGLTVSSLWMPIDGAAMNDALDWLAEEIMPKLGGPSARY